MINLGKTPFIACALNDRDVLSLNANLLDPADIIELRIDMFENIDERHVFGIFKSAREKFRKPIIATIRDIREGGSKEIKDRIGIYKLVTPISDLIDVEINSEILNDIKEICSLNMKILIGSYHNFLATPDYSFLEEIYSNGKGQGCDIVKIAVMPNNKEDIIRLIEFTLRHRNEQIITMAMGEIGLPTRIFNPLIGSLITYGYINRPSAPGQLSINEINHMFRILKIR